MQENFDNYLIATIKLPIKVSVDGNLYTLNDYVNITIENMMDRPIKSSDSIYDKVVEYISDHPEYFKRRKCYFREMLAETNDETNEKTNEKTNEMVTETNEMVVETNDESNDETNDETNEIKTELNQTLLHSFPYFNRRKKPLNITFRAKGKSRSFTKKNYF
jgi:hypothetical protein